VNSAPASDGRVALAIGCSLFLLLAAGGVWLLGLAAGDGTDCPHAPHNVFVTGMDTPRSLWPPGVECVRPAESGPARHYVLEPIPQSRWIIGGLAGSAVLILFAGMTAAIREFRTAAEALETTR
jgi:hypothetical protein